MARHGLAAGARALLSEKDRLSGSRIALLSLRRDAQRSEFVPARTPQRPVPRAAPAPRYVGCLEFYCPRVAPCSSIGASGLMRAEGCKWVFIGVFEFLMLVYFLFKINYALCYFSLFYQILSRPSD